MKITPLRLSLIILFLVSFYQNQLLSQSVFPFCKGNLYGLVSSDGTIILSPKYDVINLSEQPANAELFVVYHQGFYGLIDKTGKEILPPQFSNMSYRGSGFAWYYNDRSNERGLHVYSFGNSKEIFNSDSLRLMEIFGTNKFFGRIYNGKSGQSMLINESGDIIIPKIEGKISIDYSDSDCPLIMMGSVRKPSFFDCNGNPTTYEAYIKNFDVNVDRQLITTEILEGVEELVGVANSLQTLPSDIKIKQEVKDNGLLVSVIGVKNGQYGLLSPEGKVLIPFEHILLDHEYGYIKSITNGYRGLFSNTGYVILSPTFRDIVMSPEYQGFFKVYTTSGYCGYANRNGKVFLPKGAMDK